MEGRITDNYPIDRFAFFISLLASAFFRLVRPLYITTASRQASRKTFEILGIAQGAFGSWAFVFDFRLFSFACGAGGGGIGA